MSWGRDTERLETGNDGVYLAWSLDGKTSLATGMFSVGPRNGKQFRYAVRLGIDDRGIAKEGCCLFKKDQLEEAVACFLKYAGEHGGTVNDPDSIEVGP